MKKLLPFVITLITGAAASAQSLAGLPLWTSSLDQPYQDDWLVHPPDTKAAVYRTADSKQIILFNGLVRRSFSLLPDAVCFDYRNMSNGQQLLRSIKPEANIALDGVEYAVGGAAGQSENAYFLPEWLQDLHANAAFQYQSLEVGLLKPYLLWKPVGWAARKKTATGISLTMHYTSALPVLKGIAVDVHYELYDGIPLIVKWVSVENKSGRTVRAGAVKNEILGIVEEESAVVGKEDKLAVQHGIYMETNYAFNNAMRYDISDQTLHWRADTSYTSQVNYDLHTPVVAEVYPEKVTGVDLADGATFKSVRTHELLIDGYDR